MKFEIKSGLNGEMLFSIETETLKLAVEAAVKSGSNLRGSDLSYSDLSGSNLSGSNLSYSNLSGSNLRGSDLSGSNLRGSDLSGSNLSGSNLSGSNLRYSDLSGSDLSGSDLSYSNLSYSNLRDSDLRGSDLSGSDLSGSNLRDSDLSGSDMSSSKGIVPHLFQLAGTKHQLLVRDYGIVQIGCHAKPLDWWENHYRSIGEKEGYTPEQIEEYGEHITAARKFMERYKLLEKPAAGKMRMPE